MPPKNAQNKRKQEPDHDTTAKDAPKSGPKQETDTKSSSADAGSKKRKTPSKDEQPSKSARRSARSTTKTQPSQHQLLAYLLSADAEALCRPEDETNDIKTRGKDIRTYSSTVMSPFEELLCAVILSRPISHRLGLRSIRTVLNAPYSFTTPKAIQSAGQDKCHQALWDARTQHKAKTAEQIRHVADVVLEKFTASKGDPDGTKLGKVLDDSGGDVDKALDTLKESIKGVGPTGLNIFLRRVQWLWEGGYPYVDDKTSLSLRKLGLPEEAEDLRKAVDKEWAKLEIKALAGKDEAQKKRRAFVVVLERAVGADLEGKTDEVVAAAAAV